MLNLIDTWAIEWGLPAAAVADLRRRLTEQSQPLASDRAAYSEGRVQQEVRLEAAYRGDIILFRNNVGQLKDSRGKPVRFGLANDSTRINEVIKSADLIGIWRRRITLADVGLVFGQFVSTEVKHEEWQPGANSEHETAQLNWAALVQQYGGLARIHANGLAFSNLPITE